MSRERAGAEARRNSETLRDEAAAYPGSERRRRCPRPTARRRVRAGRPLLLALPPELARRALDFLPRCESERLDRIARNAAFMQSIGLGDSVAGAAAALAHGTYRRRLRAVCFACLELGEERRQRYVPWEDYRLQRVRESRDRDWGHVSRGWRWTFNEATTTLLDAARAPPQPGPIDPALLAAANSLPPRDRRRALRAAAPTAFESLGRRGACGAEGHARFPHERCRLRGLPARPRHHSRGDLVARRDLTMLTRYAIFDRWAAALSACEVEANKTVRISRNITRSPSACPIRTRALAAFRASCTWRRGRPAAAADRHARRRCARAGGRVAVAETALAGRPTTTASSTAWRRLARRQAAASAAAALPTRLGGRGTGPRRAGPGRNGGH